MSVRPTRWTLVLRAGAGSLSALEDLCGAYWFPVYAWFRKRGMDAEDAAEQTQEFFAGLLRRGDLGKVENDGRRFRAWLYTALASHHGNVRRAEQTQRRKRIEVDDAEARFATEVAPGLDPEQSFARQWALATLATARDRVRESYDDRGQGELFAALEPTLTASSSPYRELAAQLDLSEGAVKVAAHRLKKRFAEALRGEVAETMDGPDEVDAELRQLMDALAGR